MLIFDLPRVARIRHLYSETGAGGFVINFDALGFGLVLPSSEILIKF